MSKTVDKLVFDVGVLRAAMSERDTAETPISVRPYADQMAALNRLSADLNVPKMALIRYGIDRLLADAAQVAA